MVESNVVSLRPPTRVLVVGSSMGAGHMTAARVLAERAASRGAQARVVDYLALPAGPQGRAERALYRWMVTRAPTVYDSIMRGWANHPSLFERLSAVGEGAFVAGLCRHLEQFEPDVVISTYNLAGQLLGRLRRRGRLSVPAVAYVTDAGAHPYWVAGDVDLHLAPLEVTARRLTALGAGRVHVVDPLVPAPSSLARHEARRELGVADGAPVALVNGGSWGVGSVTEAASCLAGGGIETYVLCGNAQRLARAVRSIPHCHPIGWTDAVGDWIAACDVVVDSAGGTTCWEAVVAGRPVVLHRPLAGHGRLNAQTLQEAGLATVTWSPEQLTAEVRRARPRRPGEMVHGTDAADLILRAA
jgi:UDP-N-acetylglucosamine:LPS N-acetylglucosamine transferase